MNRLGKYEIISEIGRGGFGIVYKARDTSLDRIVALKVLKPLLTDDPSFMERFRREAQSAANLKHPNIVTIHDFGEDQGKYFIAMEYLEGTSLAQTITKSEALPLERAGRFVAQIAAALDYAHSKGLIHRDVKPSNIIIGPKDHVTLTDFGLAKAESRSGLSTSGQMIGSAEYMAPEQAEGKTVDARTDEYALGIVLFEMLTGSVPFKADTTLATLYKQVNEFPPSIRGLRQDLPEVIENVINKALAKEPDARYQTTSAMSNEIQAVLNKGKPKPSAATQKPSRSERVKSSGRSKQGMAMGIAILSIFALVSTLIIWRGVAPVQLPAETLSQARVIATTMNPSTIITVTMAAPTTPPEAPTPTHAPTNTMPTLALLPTQTATFLPPTATPTPRAGDERVIGGAPMVYIPAGEFTMGSDRNDEKPIHSIYLDEFWIDKYEVTNAQYAKCTEASKCVPPAQTKSANRASYFNNALFYNYPVIFVSWDDASRFCVWAGKRMPTEAEWEKAARGVDSRAYPWGNSFDAKAVNAADSSPQIWDTTEVGKYLAGASPYGVMDMSGNVWEWVYDWYSTDYYANSPKNNPKGPASGTNHVLRGGSFVTPKDFVRTTDRSQWTGIGITPERVGFRCAR